MGKKRLRFIIGGVVIVVAVVALVAFAMTKNSVFYYTVSELQAKGQSENVRVSGDLVRGTIQEGRRRRPHHLQDPRQDGRRQDHRGHVYR